MLYVRRKRDNQYLYYIAGESTSYGKLKDAIPLETQEQAQAFKNFAETRSKENCEIVSVVTTINVIEQPVEEQKIDNPFSEEE